MNIQAIKNHRFGMMVPTPIYTNAITDTVPAIVQKVQVSEIANYGKKFLQQTIGLPLAKADKFIKKEAIISDFKIKILNPDGTIFVPSQKPWKIITAKLKGPGREHKSIYNRKY